MDTETSEKHSEPVLARLTPTAARRIRAVARALRWPLAEVLRELVAAGLPQLEARAARMRADEG